MAKKINVKKIILVVACIYIGVIFVRQQIIIKNIKKEITQKNVELQKVKNRNQLLEDEVKMSNTDEYIEKIAREKLGLIKPGEEMVLDKKK